MDEERVKRIGQNEALYRLVNERIDDLQQSWGGSDELSIICECGQVECTQQLTVTRSVYEATRAVPSHFLARRGHEVEEVERVIEAHGDAVKIEKLPPLPEAIAEATDPRSA